jgi:hypothetical protein
MIKLTEARAISPYKWVHPNEEAVNEKRSIGWVQEGPRPLIVRDS